ncbi:MAG: hypothetical protein FWE90_13790, partial [Defluviitaleaceae bacterium]|nr:hypothetical protein [Defluviitaleaceae bacterium]
RLDERLRFMTLSFDFLFSLLFNPLIYSLPTTAQFPLSRRLLGLCQNNCITRVAIIAPQQTTEAATSQGRVLPSPKGPSGADKGRTAPCRLFLKRALYPVTP